MTAISTDKKLRVKFCLESGCLGPEGANLIDEFCEFAQQEITSFNADFIVIEISPRVDKTLPEIQYGLNGKGLDSNQASRYLKMFEQNLSSFEAQLDEKLVMMIEKFFDR